MAFNSFVEWIVEEDFSESRIDYFFKKKYPKLSYPSICKLFRKGLVRVNGRRVKNSCSLTLGDKIRITRNLNLKDDLKTEKKVDQKYINKIRSWLIYRDNNFIAINKPSDIAVQGGTKVGLNIDDILHGLQFSSNERPRLVHRLDKNTSGVLIFARTLKAAVYISELFKKRLVKKTYLTVIQGKLEKMKGKINKPIISGSKELDSLTFYEVIDSKNNVHLLKVNPITGRKNQIRKHFFLNKTPILGENKFIDFKTKNLDQSKKLLLHAYKMEFTDFDGKKINLNACIPKYFKEFIENLRLNNSIDL